MAKCSSVMKSVDKAVSKFIKEYENGIRLYSIWASYFVFLCKTAYVIFLTVIHSKSGKPIQFFVLRGRHKDNEYVDIVRGNLFKIIIAITILVATIIQPVYVFFLCFWKKVLAHSFIKKPLSPISQTFFFFTTIIISLIPTLFGKYEMDILIASSFVSLWLFVVLLSLQPNSDINMFQCSFSVTYSMIFDIIKCYPKSRAEYALITSASVAAIFFHYSYNKVVCVLSTANSVAGNIEGEGGSGNDGGQGGGGGGNSGGSGGGNSSGSGGGGGDGNSGGSEGGSSGKSYMTCFSGGTLHAQVSEEYRLVPGTLYLIVNLLDRCLSKNYKQKQKLQLLGVTCMLIASKYEEMNTPEAEEFCYITANTCAKEEEIKMERRVLNFVSFQLSVPTPKTFLRRYVAAAQATNKNPTLEYYGSYNAGGLKATVIAMQDLQLNTSDCQLNAMRVKYSNQKQTNRRRRFIETQKALAEAGA